MGILVLALLAPLNLLLRHRPEDLGLEPDGDESPRGSVAADRRANSVVDPAWVAVDWTLGRALRTTRFWCMAVGYFCGLFAWYAVQVHQTKYLVEIGFSVTQAAWALGGVSLAGIPGQIVLGHVFDRSVIGAIPAEIFQGPHYGIIFGTLMLAAILGGAIGPWVTGVLHDTTGSYTLAFLLAIGCSILSAGAIWLAGPRQVHTVAGRIQRHQRGQKGGP
jgi:cyanate permease